MWRHCLLASVVACASLIVSPCTPVNAQVREFPGTVPGKAAERASEKVSQKALGIAVEATRETTPGKVPERVHPRRLTSEDGLTPVLYDVRIPDVVSTTIKAYDSGSEVYVPLIPMLELAGVRYTVDSVRNIARFNKRDLLLTGPTVFRTHDSVYVRLSVLATQLGIEAFVDREDATITLTNVARLPVVRNTLRAAARAALDSSTRRGGDQSVNGDLVDGIEVDDAFPSLERAPSSSWGDMLVDYAVFQQRVSATSNTSISLAAGTSIGPGTVLTRLTHSGSRSRGDAAWFAVWPATRELKQLRLGSGASSGLASIPIHGIYLSNAPFSRPPRFNRFDLTGALPPDWSIEAYRDGTLIGFDSIGSTGRYSLTVPLHYGENPYELIAYSPTGEALRFGRMIRTHPGMLPDGAFEFAASTGACATRTCTWMMNLDLRYGLSNRWTLRGGATEYTWRDRGPAEPDGTTNVYPYVAIDGFPARGLTVSAEFMRSGYTQLGLTWDPSRTLTLSGDYTTYSASTAGQTLATNMRHQLWMLARFTPFGSRGALEAQLTNIATATTTHTFLRAGTSFAVNEATVRPYLRVAHNPASRTTLGGMDIIMSGGRVGLPLWGLRSTVESRTTGDFTYADAMVTRSNLFGVLSGEAGLRWRPNSRPYIAISLTTDFAQVRAQSSTIASFRGDVESMYQGYSGSLRWDNTTRQLIRSPNPNLERAGVSGIVFLDENGNNLFDAGEQPIANASLQIDDATVVSNARGYYELWGISPGQIVGVRIDPATLESPWWVPAQQTLRIATAPNRAISLNIPVVIGGIVEGAIVSDDGCVAGGPVTLKHRTSNRRYTVTPFSDGTFYRMGLLPGTYDVQVAPSSGISCGGAIPARTVTIVPNQTTSVELLLVRK